MTARLDNRGFTLVELSIVLLIIGIVTGVADHRPAMVLQELDHTRNYACNRRFERLVIDEIVGHTESKHHTRVLIA